MGNEYCYVFIDNSHFSRVYIYIYYFIEVVVDLSTFVNKIQVYVWVEICGVEISRRVLKSHHNAFQNIRSIYHNPIGVQSSAIRSKYQNYVLPL